MNSDAMWSFVVAIAVATAVPGPTVAALVARVLGQGMRGAPAFCTGLVIGDLSWCGASLLGLGALAQTAQTPFLVIKYGGALYLLWLGWKLWVSSPQVLQAEPLQTRDSWRPLGAGLAIAMGNPKTMLFYLALLPSLINLGELTMAGYVEISTLLVLVYSAVLGSYVLLATRARHVLLSTRAILAVNRAAGVVMAGAAVTIAAR